MFTGRMAAELITLVGLVLLAVTFVRWSFFGLGALPKGDLINSYPSPTGRYRLDVYLVDSGITDTVDLAIRAVAVDTRTRRAKTIYWQCQQPDVNVLWIDDETVRISGPMLGKEQQVELNVTRDQYDWRNAR